MRPHPTRDEERIALARRAAEQLFEAGLAAPGPSLEPSCNEEASAAVQRLGELFEELPGIAAEALDAASNSGSLLASDRLQCLAEIVQNADDLEASEVRFLLMPTELWASHDGAPVRLRDVAGLATPWLSTKVGDEAAIGRFGVGLSTLRSLSETLDVHCAPYHVRIGDPTVAPVKPGRPPDRFNEPGWTTMRVPLQAGAPQTSDIEAWLDRWDDSALLFLRHVAQVTLLEPNGRPIRRLAISRHRNEGSGIGLSTCRRAREFAETADGRSWAVYSTDVPSPQGASRAQKATGDCTPIAVALDSSPTDPDVSVRQLRQKFEHGGLVLTKLGWRPPERCSYGRTGGSGSWAARPTGPPEASAPDPSR